MARLPDFNPNHMTSDDETIVAERPLLPDVVSAPVSAPRPQPEPEPVEVAEAPAIDVPAVPVLEPQPEPEDSPNAFRERLRAARERDGGGAPLAGPEPSGLVLPPSALQTDLEADGAIDRLRAMNERTRTQRVTDAIRDSARDFAEGVRDPQQWREGAAGLFIDSPANTIGAIPQMLAAMDPGEAVAIGFNTYRDHLSLLPEMSEQEVEDLRGEIGRAWGRRSPSVNAALQHAITRVRNGESLESVSQAFPMPTPMGEHPFYQAGETVRRFGRELAPPAPGYEQSVGRDFGSGIGSLLTGVAAAMAGGPLAAGTFFTGLGMNEAQNRAVEFDRTERAAGRPGLSPEQILGATLLGVGPGATDWITVSMLLGRTPVPMTSLVRNATARVIARIGGVGFVEATQEAGQQAMQNLISYLVYNPNQDVTDGMLRSFGIGLGVGTTAESGRTALAGLGVIRRTPSASARPGRTTTDTPSDAAPAPQPQPAPAPQAVPDDADPFGLSRTTPEPQAAPQAQPEAPAPQPEVPPPQPRERITIQADEVPPTDYDIPAPAAATWQLGQPRAVITPDGAMEVEATPEIVDLATLRAASGDLQPRDRSRAESDIAIQDIAANLDPEQLMPGRVSDAGAPIITGDNTVLSGNGRVDAIRRAYSNPALRQQAEAYRRSLGPAAANMRQPVLVMRLPRSMQRDQLRQFADLSNRSRISAMSATERALRDAAAAGSDIMAQYQGGLVTSPANSEFFRGFINQVVTATERGQFSRDGNLTKEGQQRITAAVLAAAYGDPELLSAMLESTDDNIRSLTGALVDSAGAFIALKTAIAVGEADAQFDVSPQVVEAVRRVADLRSRNIKPAAFLAQQDAFTQLDPIVESLIRSFYTADMGRPLSRQRITELLTGYATEAAKHTAEGLIPDQTTPREVVQSTSERLARGDAIAARFGQQPDIFAGGQPAVDASGASPDGLGDAGRGEQAQGRGDAGRGPTARGAGNAIEGTGPVQPDQSGFQDQGNLRRRFASLIAGRLPASKWQQSLRVSPEQFQALIDEGVAAGFLRVDRNGEIRRTPAAKDMPLDALSRETPAQITDDDAEMQRFAIEDMAGRNQAAVALEAGQSVDIDPVVVNAVLEATAPALRMVPADVRVGSTYRIEPATESEINTALALGVKPPAMRLHARTHDGRTFSTLSTFSPKQGLQAPALYTLDAAGTASIVFISFGTFGTSNQFLNAFRGKLGHELIHVLMTSRRSVQGSVAQPSRLIPADRAVLVRASHDLGLLNLTFREYGALINSPNWEAYGNSQIRQVYQNAYSNLPRDMFDDYIAQEEVAFAFDLFLHGGLTQESLGPEAFALFTRIAAGEFGRSASLNFPAGAVRELARQQQKDVFSSQRVEGMRVFMEARKHAQQLEREGAPLDIIELTTGLVKDSKGQFNIGPMSDRAWTKGGRGPYYNTVKPAEAARVFEITDEDKRKRVGAAARADLDLQRLLRGVNDPRNQRDPIAEAMEERRKLSPKEVHALINAARRDPSTNKAALVTVTGRAITQAEEQASFALSLANSPEAEPQDVLDAFAVLREARETRDNFQAQLLAIQNSDEDADWQEVYWETLSQRGTLSEISSAYQAEEDVKRAPFRPMVRSSAEVAADNLFTQALDLEHRLADQPPADAARIISQAFGTPVTAAQIATGTAWWHVDQKPTTLRPKGLGLTPEAYEALRAKWNDPGATDAQVLEFARETVGTQIQARTLGAFARANRHDFPERKLPTRGLATKLGEETYRGVVGLWANGAEAREIRSFLASQGFKYSLSGIRNAMVRDRATFPPRPYERLPAPILDAITAMWAQGLYKSDIAKALSTPEQKVSESAVARIVTRLRLREKYPRAKKPGDHTLFAIQNVWSDEDIRALHEAELDEADRKRRPIASSPVDPSRKLFDKRSNPIDRTMRQMRELERSMSRDGKSAGEIATTIRERFGFDVDPADIAKGMAWYRVDELLHEGGGSSPVRWTPKADAALEQAWKSGLSIVRIAEHLRGVLDRPKLSYSAVAARALQNGLTRKSTKAWTDAMDEALQAPATRTLKATAAARSLSEAFGVNVTADTVTYHRRRLGTRERENISEASRQFLLSEQGKGLTEGPAAKELSRIEGRPVSTSIVGNMRARLRAEGLDVGTPASRGVQWSPEETAALDKATVDGLSLRAISEMMRTQFGRIVGRGPIHQKIKRRKAEIARFPVGTTEFSTSVAEGEDSFGNLVRVYETHLADDAARAAAEGTAPPTAVSTVTATEQPDGSWAMTEDGASSDQIKDAVRQIAAGDIGTTLLAINDDKGRNQPYIADPPSRAFREDYRVGEVESLTAIIDNLKDVLGLTVTQGRYGITITDRASGRTWTFRPTDRLRGQYEGAGVARVRWTTDIEAIAHEGGHHLERVLGPEIDAFKAQHMEDLGAQAAPDRAVPPMAPTGFSGLEIDAETQTLLVDAANAMREWRVWSERGGRARQTLFRTPISNNRADPAYYALSARAATLRRRLERRLGTRIASTLIGDILGDRDNVVSPDRRRQLDTIGRAEIPANEVAAYVRERYSRDGTPQPRAPLVVAPRELSEGFAEFFRQYVLNPDAARRQYPGVFVAFNDFLDGTSPQLLEAFERAQLGGITQAHQAYVQTTAVERAVADVATLRDPTTWERIKAVFKTGNRAEVVGQWLSSLSFQTTDMTNPALKLRQALMVVMDANGIRDADGRPVSLRPAEDPHFHARMFPQSFKVGHQSIVNGVTPYGSLKPEGPNLHEAIVDALGGTSRFRWSERRIDRFNAYLEGQRAIVEWARYLKSTDPHAFHLIEAKVKAYFNSADVSETIDAGSESGRPPYRKGFDEYWKVVIDLDRANPQFRAAAVKARDWQHRLLAMEHAAGRWTDEEFAAMSKRREFYTPAMREFTDLMSRAVGTAAAAQAGARFQKSKRFFGSDRNVVGPLEIMAIRAYATAEAVQRNDMANALAQLSDRAGPGAADFVERIEKTETLPATASAWDRIRQDLVSQGMDPADAMIAMQAMEEHFTDGEIHLLYKPEILGPIEPLTMPLWQKGRRSLIRLNDVESGRKLLSAMNEMGRGAGGWLINILAFPAAVLRAGVVMHPAYVMANIAGDAMQQMVLTGAMPGANHMRGLWYEISARPGGRRVLEAMGITPSDLASMQDRVGLIGGGQLSAAIQERHGNRKNLDLRELRRKGYSVLDIRAIGGVVSVGIGGLMGGTSGAALGAVLGAPITGAVIGATLGMSVGAMTGRVLFGQGAETIFARMSEFSETAGRRGLAAYATKRALAFDPSMSEIDAIREGVFAANDVMPFDRRGFGMGAALRVVPFLNSSAQGTSRTYRQAWMLDGSRGSVIKLPALQGGLLGAGAAMASTALIGGAVGPFAVAGAAAGAVAGRMMLGKSDTKAVKMWLRYMLTRTADAEAEFKANVSKSDEAKIRAGARLWVTLVLIGVAGALLKMLYWNDPEYEDVDRETKFNHWVFRDYWGTWIRLRRFDYGLPAIAAEALVDTLAGRDPRFAEHLRDGLIATHMPPVLPQTFRLAAATLTGVDTRTGRDVVPDRIRQRQPADLQYNAYTSAFSVHWARALNSMGMNVSPMVVDYALSTELAYWGREIRSSSDYFFGNRAPKSTDLPLIGAMINRFTVDPSRRSESVNEFLRVMSREGSRFRGVAVAYKDLLDSGNPDTPIAHLVRLSRPEREYAVLETHFQGAEKILHPMNRASAIFTINSALRRELAEAGVINGLAEERGNPIVLTPSQQSQVDTILGNLSTVEMWNGLHGIGRPGWAGRNARDPQPILDELQQASPDIYNELIRRRSEKHIGTWPDDRDRWTDIHERVRQMIDDRDLLGVQWDNRFNQRKAPTRRRQEGTLPQ